MRLDDVVNHFLLDCETRGLTPRAIKWYRNELNFVVQKLAQECKVTELEDVKIVHLRQLVQMLLNTKRGENHPRQHVQDKALSAYTVRGYVRAIKAFFRWCVREELLDTDPSVRLAQPKGPSYVIRTFTPEHIEAMLGACDLTTPLGFRDYTVLLLLLDTGMRLSEINNLRVTDVYDRYVKVFGKGRKEREIGIHPEVGRLLWKYIHKYRKPADPNETRLFLGRHGTPLHQSGVKRY